MSDPNVTARAAALAEEAWRHLTSRVIDNMLASGEDVSDTALYRQRMGEAVSALMEKLKETAR